MENSIGTPDQLLNKISRAGETKTHLLYSLKVTISILTWSCYQILLFEEMAFIMIKFNDCVPD